MSALNISLATVAGSFSFQVLQMSGKRLQVRVPSDSASSSSHRGFLRSTLIALLLTMQQALKTATEA